MRYSDAHTSPFRRYKFFPSEIDLPTELWIIAAHKPDAATRSIFLMQVEFYVHHLEFIPRVVIQRSAATKDLRLLLVAFPVKHLSAKDKRLLGANGNFTHHSDCPPERSRGICSCF
jgi:hypothetical protein